MVRSFAIVGKNGRPPLRRAAENRSSNNDIQQHIKELRHEPQRCPGHRGPRSTRSFADSPVSPEDLESLFEAARLAPSSLNSQPWRFKAVTDAETLAWFGTTEATRAQAWLSKAPAIIVCCADLSGYVRDSQAAAFFYRENKVLADETLNGIEAYVKRAEHDPEQAKYGACAMNVGLAVSLMMLQAVEMGFGTCWVGMFNEAAVKERLGLGADLRVVCLLAVGKPGEAAPAPRKRKSLAEIVLP